MGYKCRLVIFGAINDPGLHTAEHFTDAHTQGIGPIDFSVANAIGLP